VVFVIEFTVGASRFERAAIDQVEDYALDLKNFHESSHSVIVAPLLVATAASAPPVRVAAAEDGVLRPLRGNTRSLADVLSTVLIDTAGAAAIDRTAWESGRYRPTPTIIEAAAALYTGHGVEAISRSDAGARNLTETTAAVEAIVSRSRAERKKSIVFVTGVPGAGKTLVGLNTATRHAEGRNEMHSVFLSGNGPLVKVLCEALAIDRVQQQKREGVKRPTLKTARERAESFIQNVHHFRDEYHKDRARPPFDHVVIFDEAQRAWNLARTADFMRRKRDTANFSHSEPEFLISCMDRHRDWAVIVCLVGGGQEINVGEAGISEWLDAVGRSFPQWEVHLSPRLHDSEYAAEEPLKRLPSAVAVRTDERLHLSVSMRSFRAENVSAFVKCLLDLDADAAREHFVRMQGRFPIVATRSLREARRWLRRQARGTQRTGIVGSSGAERLRPLAIDVRRKIDPAHWFLKGRSDVRSSCFLEDVATEFHVQGLELDWTCVVWDADFRWSEGGWQPFRFQSSRWLNVNKDDRRAYLKNAYRVLLTRARLGMVIVVPKGRRRDRTRNPAFYDGTWDYMRSIGIPELPPTVAFTARSPRPQSLAPPPARARSKA
ncbi:MAG: DUF2075 domain-containing protein, partial [Phycisphaerales bacterium]|nr:DUF2075 domain-containing protein [Phycisphaerales bacterium]